MNTNENKVVRQPRYPMIRTMVRSVYDLQKLRVSMGNRITGNFKAKLGMTSDGMSERQLASQDKKILSRLRESYKRITDGIIVEGNLPTVRKFKGDELITEYVELVLVDQYVKLLKQEERAFKDLDKTLSNIPIYSEYLSEIDGVGPAIAGILISEIDIREATYPSSLHRYAGLDVITYGTYTDDDGKKHTIPAHDLYNVCQPDEITGELMYKGCVVTEVKEGMSRKSHALTLREYTNTEGKSCMRFSITFNPFLKTKLIGVLAGSFLRAGGVYVDAKKMSTARRLELAISYGLNTDDHDDSELQDAVNILLQKNGHVVETAPSKYGTIYYNYKNRLENSPHHKEKTALHRNNMALRYMVKQFLTDLYLVWRKIEGLPVAEPYEVAKLGLVHGVVSEGKLRKAA